MIERFGIENVVGISVFDVCTVLVHLLPEVINLIKRQSCHDIETSQLICSANQLTAFYMMASLAFNKLIFSALFLRFPTISRRSQTLFWKMLQNFFHNTSNESFLAKLQALVMQNISWEVFPSNFNGIFQKFSFNNKGTAEVKVFDLVQVSLSV